MTTSYDTDPNTQTIAAAWASSELGQPESEVRYGFATTGPTESVTTSEEEPTARRVTRRSSTAGTDISTC
jgi:hypothetical protein